MEYRQTVYVFRYVLLLFGLRTLDAQSLDIPPVTATRGAAQILRIVFKAAASRPVASLQWELVYPNALQIDLSGVVPGSVTESAGKTLVCARRKPAAGENALGCVLSGGVRPLQDGTIAIIRFVPAASGPKNLLHVRLDKIAAVSPKLDQIVIPNANGSVTIK
jgi:hypothetical protein